jgi:hypothetical protein
MAEVEEHRATREAAALREEVGRLSRELLESEQVAARALELQRRLEELESECGELIARNVYCEEVIADMQSSVSWRITAPLRGMKALLRRRARAN